MGQKSNSNLLRLKNTNYFFNYIEKNNEESSFLLYQQYFINNFLLNYLKRYGITLINCKLYRSNTNLNIFFSYYVTSKIKKIIKLKTNKYKLMFKKLICILKIYTFNKLKIFIIFQNLSNKFSIKLKNINQKKTLTNIKKQLKIYKNHSFFKKLLPLFIIIIRKNTPKLLSEYIAFQLSLLKKKHNFFLTFLRHALKLFLNSNINCLNGLKILISGRFNGISRARKKSFKFGKLPLNTLSNNINYFESVAYTLNGTFGIKVWILKN